MQPVSQTFRYREHVRKMPKLLGIMGVVFCGLGLVSALFTQSLVIVVIVAFLAVEFGFLAWFTRRIGTTEITLHADHIEMTNCAKQVRIRYDEIEKVESAHIPWLGGWARVRGRDGSKIRATVTLEGIGVFLAGLKWRVDRSNLAPVYDRRKLFGFFKTATYAEQSWRRLGRAALPFLMLACFAPMFLVDLGPVVAIVGFAGFAVYMWCEFVFARHIAKNADDVRFTAPERDMALERRTFIHAAVAWAVVVVPTLIYALAL